MGVTTSRGYAYDLLRSHPVVPIVDTPRVKPRNLEEISKSKASTKVASRSYDVDEYLEFIRGALDGFSKLISGYDISMKKKLLTLTSPYKDSSDYITGLIKNESVPESVRAPFREEYNRLVTLANEKDVELEQRRGFHNRSRVNPERKKSNFGHNLFPQGSNNSQQNNSEGNFDIYNSHDYDNSPDQDNDEEIPLPASTFVQTGSGDPWERALDEIGAIIEEYKSGTGVGLILKNPRYHHALETFQKLRQAVDPESIKSYVLCFQNYCTEAFQLNVPNSSGKSLDSALGQDGDGRSEQITKPKKGFRRLDYRRKK